MEQEPILNEHNKEEFPPSHTAEHLLNQTMIRMFGCERSRNAHIERKKSKISYIIDHKPDRKEEKEIEINTIVEIVQSKLNTDVKPLNILTNKHLYRGIFLALFVLPLVIYVFKNEIRKGLIYILGEKIEKKN